MGPRQLGLRSEHQLLANRGYAVLSVNYRGSTGFGKKFTNAGNKEWAGKMHDDLIDAVDWAIAEKIADPKSVAIMGGSYGGYATLVGLTFTPDKFACGVDIVGPSNLLTLLQHDSALLGADAANCSRTASAIRRPTRAKSCSTSDRRLNFVDASQRPLLIGQGANDPRVKQCGGRPDRQRDGEESIPVTYVLFPDEGHGFARPENNLAFYAVTEAFLARQLGGRFETIGGDFAGSSITSPQGADQIPGLAEALKKQASQERAQADPAGK